MCVCIPSIIKIGYFYTRVIQKIKAGRFGTQCTLATLLAQTLPFGNVTGKEKKPDETNISPAASVVQDPDPSYSEQSKWPAANNVAGHSRANESKNSAINYRMLQYSNTVTIATIPIVVLS